MSDSEYYVEYEYGTWIGQGKAEFYNKDEALEYARNLASEGEIEDENGRMREIMSVILYDENNNRIWSKEDEYYCLIWSKEENKKLKDEIKQLKLQLEKQTLSNVLDKKIPLGTKSDINEILNSVGYTE